MSATRHITPEFRGNLPRDLQTLRAWTKLRDEEALDPGLPIIDPHHHLMDDGHGRYLLDDFLEDLSTGHNIVSTVYVQVKAMYRATGPVEMRPVGEVEFANGVAAVSASGHYGNTRICEGIVGFADLTLGGEVEAVLDAQIRAGNGRLRGIRYGATWDDGSAGYGRTFAPRHLLRDTAFRDGFARLAPLKLSFDAWLFYPQLPDLVDLLDASPDTQVVLDHCGGILGIPPHSDQDAVFKAWRGHLVELSRFPNLNVKIGGLGMLYGGWDFHTRPEAPASVALAEAWKPYVEACIEVFGTNRCMFESNFPVDKQSCGYGALWNAFKRITQGYTADEKAALFHDTAARVYRLGDHAGSPAGQ